MTVPWDPTALPRRPALWLTGWCLEAPKAAGDRGLTTLTVGAGPPWGAGAGAGHRVTGCPLPTSAYVRTAGAEAAQWTGCREEMGGWLLGWTPVCLPGWDRAGWTA